MTCQLSLFLCPDFLKKSFYCTLTIIITHVCFLMNCGCYFLPSFGGFAVCQICIISSTSAGLEQTLPWIFYHKVIGVSTFFLFVEGKAASPDVSKVLESIPGSINPLFLLFICNTLLLCSTVYSILLLLLCAKCIFCRGESDIWNKRIGGTRS